MRVTTGREIAKAPQIYCQQEIVDRGDSTGKGLRRAKNRSSLDRFEQEAIDFHRRVREAYLERATEFSDRIRLISCDNQSKDAIFDEIIGQIKKKRQFQYS